MGGLVVLFDVGVHASAQDVPSKQEWRHHNTCYGFCDMHNMKWN